MPEPFSATTFGDSFFTLEVCPRHCKEFQPVLSCRTASFWNSHTYTGNSWANQNSCNTPLGLHIHCQCLVGQSKFLQHSISIAEAIVQGISFVSVKCLLSTFVAAVNVHFISIVIGTSLMKFFPLDICYLNHFQPQLLAIHSLLWKFLVIGLGIVRNGPASSLTCRQFLNSHTVAMPH